jgi:hypothetical protein
MECENKGITTTFVCGKRGLDALRERVVSHFESEGHIKFRPVNPKPGTFYVIAGTKHRIGPTYKKGDDQKEWVNEVMEAAMSAGTRVEPSWELAE